MGPEPIPTLDIEMSEIQNELQRKMVEEIRCVKCQNFPYAPMECKNCNKLFCKYCQLQMQSGQEREIDLNDPEIKARMASMQPEERKSYLTML